MFTQSPMLARTALALVPLLFAGAAAAQSVGNVKGSVLVNHGAGFAPISAPTPLRTGDTVMARAGGSATLKYADGCKVDVIPGTVLTLENVSPCSIVNAVDPSDNAVAQTENSPGTEGGGAPPAPPLPPAFIAGGVFAAVAGTGHAVGLSSDNNNESPISP
jgi:tetrahydromethanopterin S-methyltransferase subunit D